MISKISTKMAKIPVTILLTVLLLSRIILIITIAIILPKMVKLIKQIKAIITVIRTENQFIQTVILKTVSVHVMILLIMML